MYSTGRKFIQDGFEPQPPIFLFNWTMAKVTDHEMSLTEIDAVRALVNEAVNMVGAA